MSEFYLFCIGVPIVIMIVLAFIFQASIEELTGEQFIANCPYPIYAGVASLIDIEGVNLIYSVSYSNSTSDFDGTFFECNYTTDPLLLGANTIIKEYDATAFSVIPIGQLGYIADYLGAAGDKFQHQVRVVWLLMNAPAEASSIAEFTFVTIGMFALIGIGISWKALEVVGR